jgi:two-component system sensor histidine kinase PilS (NtrC family)
MARDSDTAATAGRAIAGDLPWRIIGLLNIFRLLVPMILMVIFVFDAPSRTIGSVYPGLFVSACAIYFAYALFSLRATGQRWLPAPWLALTQLAADTLAITLLIHTSGGVASGLGTLLLLPAAATAVVVGPRLALVGPAVATLALLYETSVSALAGIGEASDFLIAGLTGASLFAITLLTIPLAGRLRESEALVKQTELDLANLNELNEFIVQHLRESILVVDTEDRIRLINDTAAQMLNAGPVDGDTPLERVSSRLLGLLRSWRLNESDRRDSIGEVVSSDGGTVIRPHFVSLSDKGRGPVLIFLEDTSVIAEKVQQSKLVSLGRLSASIAHEIRNPVGAMSHASQLLRESDALGADDAHLTEIIEKNAVRVSQIIENVLQLSRRETTRQQRLDLRHWLDAFLQEFRDTAQLEENVIHISNAAGETIPVHFDPTHLHQVLWNLCDNAIKHGAGDGSQAIELRLGRIASTGRPFLEIADTGAGVDPEHAERLFEPFFTNGAGGTGLGLFISRELCQTNGAMLLYEPRPSGGSLFRIVFADPSRWEWSG